MKKAYILTFFYGTNYGSKLQATALKKYLEQHDYEVVFIKTFLEPAYLLRHPSLLYTRILNLLKRKERIEFYETEPYIIKAERQKRIDKYNEDNLKYISITKRKQWKKIISEEPIFISGSDIIWQPANGYPEKYFLDFAYYTNCKRIAYASSVGAKELPRKYRKYYKKYLGSYDAISVRENATKSLFAGIIDNEITKVIDPTLLVSRNIWDELSTRAQIDKEIIPNDYILCYFVMKDARYWDYVEKAAKETKMKVVVLPMHKQDEETGYYVVDNGTPYEFIWLIRNAAFIITDSFHASVFSYLYHKEFYILKRTRSAEDEKFVDLTTRYELEDRIVRDEATFIKKNNVERKEGINQLEYDREQSALFLNKALGLSLHTLDGE